MGVQLAEGRCDVVAAAVVDVGADDAGGGGAAAGSDFRRFRETFDQDVGTRRHSDDAAGCCRDVAEEAGDSARSIHRRHQEAHRTDGVDGAFVVADGSYEDCDDGAGTGGAGAVVGHNSVDSGDVVAVARDILPETVNES